MRLALCSGYARSAARTAICAAASVLLVPMAACSRRQTLPPSPSTGTGVDSVAHARVGTLSAPRRPGRVCTAERRAGIVVDVQDSVTGAPLALRALAVATRDGQVDSVRHVRAPSDIDEAADERRLRLWLAWEQPGTYDLAIHVDGYAVWRRTGVTVQAGPCHVVPTRLVARLVRE